MDVLLFTHKSDIDGMGNVVLAKLAFENVEYILCETFNLQENINKYISDGSIYKFDMVFVTDLWLEEPTLSKIANDKKLKNKFFVFDHHRSAIEGNFNKYDFTTIKVLNDNGLCSGTSLFYDYLTTNNFINKNYKCIYDFSELTRKYDTWEWKTKYNDELPHELTLLFDSVGSEGYIDLMYNKLSNYKDKDFVFNDFEKMLINNKKIQVIEKLLNYEKQLIIRRIFGYKCGIVFIDFEYRNDFAEYLREINANLDLVMLISLDYGVISYRRINNDINIRLIAEKMGGKGNEQAASSPISNITKCEIINTLLEHKK